MTVDAHPRLLLVLAATRSAQQQARRLGLDGVLENLVAEAFAEGRVTNTGAVRRNGAVVRAGVLSDEPVGESRYAWLAGDVRVEVRRTKSPTSRRKCWLPVAVEKVPPRTTTRRRNRWD